MDIVSRLGAEAECRRLMTLFNWHVDARDYKSVLSLFVDNCTFVRIDTAHQGKESVMRLLEARPRQRRTRHLLSNVVVDVRDDSSGDGPCLLRCVRASRRIDRGGRGAFGTSGLAYSYTY